MTTTSATTMRALAVTAWGTPPALTQVPKPTQPESGSTQIRVLASALPNLVRSQASGQHYSVRSAPLPYLPGIDAVGYTPDSKLVYANLFSAKPQGGGFAEYANADNRAITPIPVPSNASEKEQNEIGIKVASLINPAMSSWMALKHRAHIADLDSFSVLILGVTSASGKIAALFARHLGAKKIIGVARSQSALADLKGRGDIDEAIVLDSSDPSKTDYSVLSNPDNIGFYPLVVLDYIYGPAALALLSALPSSPNQSESLEVRYVHIGTLGKDQDISLPGPLLRSKNVIISGSGPGSWSVKKLAGETPELVKAIAEVLPAENWREQYAVVERTLEEGEVAWEKKNERTVFVV